MYHRVSLSRNHRLNPLTDVASKWFFFCDLSISGHCNQFLIVTLALAMCGIPCTYNGLLATVYLQWFTCDANFHPIEIIIVPSHMSILMKAYEMISTMVKIA